MPCPICTGALISTVAQSAAAVSLAKHVKDRTMKKPKSKSKQLKKKSE
jgi:predicted transporter